MTALWSDDGRPFDWGRNVPRVLDVGCGEGGFLIGSAVARPDHDHLGIDILSPVIRRAASSADRRDLANIRFVAGDAVAWLFGRLVPDSIDEIHVYHPQPYYDPSVVPTRMLSPEFFERAWLLLRRKGLLVLQTDVKAYGRHLLELARKHFDPEVLPGPWPDAPAGRTKRERVARRKGLDILRIAARRREAALDIAVPAFYFDRPGVRRRRIKKR